MSLLENAKKVPIKISINKVPTTEEIELTIAWAKKQVNTAQAAVALGLTNEKAASRLNKYLRYAVNTGVLK